MEYNKNQFIKSSDHKVLHKVKKNWVVLSMSLLALLGGGAVAHQTAAHADTNGHQANDPTTTLKNRINSSLTRVQTVSSQESTQSNVHNNQQINPQQINQQANTLHNRILMNATQNGTSQAHSENDNTDIGRETNNNETSVNTQQIPSHQSSLSDQIEQPSTKNYVQGKTGNQTVKNNQGLKQMVVNQPMVGSASGTFEGLNYTSDGTGTVTFTGKFPKSKSSISDFFSNGAYGNLPSNPVTNARNIVFGTSDQPVDFSNVSSLQDMFNDSKNPNINQIDFNNVTGMNHVQNMSQMFGSYENRNLNSVIFGKGFDMSGVTNDSGMLGNTGAPIDNKNNVLVTSTNANIKPDMQSHVTYINQKETGTYQGLNYTYYPDTQTTEFTGGTLNWSDGSIGGHDFITKSNNQSASYGNEACPVYIDASKHIKFDNGVKIPQVTTGNRSNGNAKLQYFIADDPNVESIYFGSDLANYKVTVEDVIKGDHMFQSDQNLKELTIPNGWFTQYDDNNSYNDNVSDALMSDSALSKLTILPSPSAYNEYTTSIASNMGLPSSSPLYNIIVNKPLSPGVYTATPSTYYKTYKGLNYTYNPGTQTAEFIGGTLNWSNPGAGYKYALIGNQTSAPSDLKDAHHIKFDNINFPNGENQVLAGLIQDDPNVQSVDLGKNFDSAAISAEGGKSLNGMFMSDYNLQEIDIPYKLMNQYNPTSSFVESDNKLSKIVIYSDNANPYYSSSEFVKQNDNSAFNGNWYSIGDKGKAHPYSLLNQNITPGIYVTDPNSNENKHQGTYDGLNYIYDPSTSTAEFTGGTLNWSYPNYTDYSKAFLGNQVTSAPSDLKNAQHIKFDNNINMSGGQSLAGFVQDDTHAISIDLGNNFANAMISAEGGNSLNNMFLSDSSLRSLAVPYKLMNQYNQTPDFVKSDNNLSEIIIRSDNANPYYNNQEFTSQPNNNNFDGNWYSINDKQKSNPINFTNENIHPGTYVLNPNNPLNLNYTHEGTAHVNIDSSHDTITVSDGTLDPGEHEFMSDIRDNNGNLLSSDSLGNSNKDWTLKFKNVTAPSDMAFVLSGGKNTTTTQNALGNQVSTIDLSGLDMSHVTNMEGMMINSNNLQHVIFGDNTNTSNVTNMDMMLGSDQSLKQVDLSKLSGKNLQQAWDLFDHDHQLSDVTLGSKLSPQGNEHVDLGEMFASDWKLPFSNIHWNGFNTKYVSQFYGMFRNDSVLGNVTLPDSFDTSHGVNFGTSPVPGNYNADCSDGMFQSDYNTHKIDLSEPNFDTSNATSMQEMFGDDKQLSDINFGDHFYTGNVTNMKRMFAYSDGFTSLTLPSTFDTSKVTDNTGMFESDTRPVNNKPSSSKYSGKLQSITIASPKTILDKGRAGVDGDTFLGAEHPTFYQTNSDGTTVSNPYDFTKSNPNASESHPKLVTQNQLIKVIVDYQFQDQSGKHLEGHNTLIGKPSDSVAFTRLEQSNNAKGLNPGWQIANAENLKYNTGSTTAPSDVTVPADPYDETVRYLNVPVIPTNNKVAVKYRDAATGQMIQNAGKDDTTYIDFPYVSAPTSKEMSSSDLEKQTNNGFPSGYKTYPATQTSFTINSNGSTVIPVVKQNVIAAGSWDVKNPSSARFEVISDSPSSRFSPNDDGDTLIFLKGSNSNGDPLDLNNWSNAGYSDGHGNVSYAFSDDGHSTNPNALNRNSIKHIRIASDEKIILPAGTTADKNLPSGAKSDTGLFQNMHHLSDITLGTNAQIDASDAQNLSSMFENDENIKRINLSDWNPSNVTITDNMFAGDTALSDLTLPKHGFGKLTSIASMFASDKSLRGNTQGTTSSRYNPNVHKSDSDIHNLNQMDVSNVSDMASAFESDTGLTGLNLSGWHDNKLSDLDAIFSNDVNLHYLDIHGLSNPDMNHGGAKDGFQNDFANPQGITDQKADAIVMSPNLRLSSDTQLDGDWASPDYKNDLTLFAPRQLDQDGSNLGPKPFATWVKMPKVETAQVQFINQSGHPTMHTVATSWGQQRVPQTVTIYIPPFGTDVITPSDQVSKQSVPQGYQMPEKSDKLPIYNGPAFGQPSDPNFGMPNDQTKLTTRGNGFISNKDNGSDQTNSYGSYDHPKSTLNLNVRGNPEHQTLHEVVRIDPGTGVEKPITLYGYYGDTSDTVDGNRWQPGPSDDYRLQNDGRFVSDYNPNGDVVNGHPIGSGLVRFNFDQGPYQQNGNAGWYYDEPRLHYGNIQTHITINFVDQNGSDVGTMSPYTSNNSNNNAYVGETISLPTSDKAAHQDGLNSSYHLIPNQQSTYVVPHRGSTFDLYVTGNAEQVRPNVKVVYENSDGTTAGRPNPHQMPVTLYGYNGDHVAFDPATMTVPSDYVLDRQRTASPDWAELQNNKATWVTGQNSSTQASEPTVYMMYTKASLRLVYLNQDGQKVGCSDVISGHVGQQVNVTDPSDGGSKVPTGYQLNGHYSYANHNNSDNGLDGQDQDTVYQLENGQHVVYLHVHGLPVSDKAASVTVYRVLEDANGQTSTMKPVIQPLKKIVGSQQVDESDGSDVEINPAASNLLPSDCAVDYSRDGVQFTQISYDSKTHNYVTSPNQFVFYYRKNQTSGAPIILRYIDENTGSQVEDPLILNGNLGQKVDVTESTPSGSNAGYMAGMNVPYGYSIDTSSSLMHFPASDMVNTDKSQPIYEFTASPQAINIPVQGNVVTKTLHLRVVERDSLNQKTLYTSDVPVKISGRIGQHCEISPYGFSDNAREGGIINSIQGLKSVNGHASDFKIPDGTHATNSDVDLPIWLDENGQLSPLSHFQYTYVQNYQAPQIGTVKIHYVASDSAANRKNDDGQIYSINGTGTNYDELDYESDKGTVGSQFDLTPYTNDLPEKLQSYYTSGSQPVIGSNGKSIQPSNYRWNFQNGTVDVYIKVSQTDNGGNNPIIVN